MNSRSATAFIPTLADIEAARPFVYQAAIRTPLVRLNADGPARICIVSGGNLDASCLAGLLSNRAA